MKRRVGAAFWIESAVAAITLFLTVLTLVWRDWIEGIFGYDPDRHDGSFEWELVIACAVLAVIFTGLARREWRRRTAAASSA